MTGMERPPVDPSAADADLLAPPEPEPARPSRRRFEKRVELAATILLAVATVAASWSAFQSTKWGGVQANSYASSSAARAEATQASDLANAQTLVDVNTFIAWVGALHAEGRAEPTGSGTYVPQPGSLSAFLYDRFRPEFRPAVQAWIATRPLVDPAAPPSPFAMPQYQLAQRATAQALSAHADDLAGKARNANQTSDNYVLLTVLFAAVLFFAGVSTKFEIHRNRIVMLTLSTVVLIGTLGVLATFPETF